MLGFIGYSTKNEEIYHEPHEPTRTEKRSSKKTSRRGAKAQRRGVDERRIIILLS
jgi:hypothetical protein